MWEDIQVREIKILLILILFTAFGLTGLSGFAFTAGFVWGDLIVEKFF
jgi:hypothetical protein